MKITKNIFIMVVFFLFMISIVSASVQVIFTESFDFSDEFVNHNYKYENGGCGADVDVPIQSTFTTNAFGNNKSVCGTSYGRGISLNFSETELSEGILFMDYDYDLINDTEDGNVMVIRLFNSVGTSPNASFGVSFIQLGNKTFVTDCDDQPNCVECSLLGTHYPIRTTFFTIKLDLDEKTYSWYFNGTTGDCLDVSYGDIPFIKAYSLGQNIADGDTLEIYIDNIIISGTNLSVEEFGLNSPCESNSDCISGNCEYGFCALKGHSEECDNDNQCLSGNCLNGKCTKPTLWEGIDASKDQQFGDDSNTNNFIALFFIIGIPACIIWVGRTTASVFIGTGIFFFLSIFFTIVGWLSPFILIGNILMALIVVVFMFMLKGGSD